MRRVEDGGDWEVVVARKDFADAVYKLYIGRGQWRHVVSGMWERIWAWIPFPSLRRVVLDTRLQWAQKNISSQSHDILPFWEI